MSYWLKSGIYALLEKGLGLVFGFGSLFLLLRILTKEEMGVWVLFLTIVSFIEVSRVGLLQNALIKFLTVSEGEEVGQISSASLFLNILLSVLSSLVLVLLAVPLAQLWEAPLLAQMLPLHVMTTLGLVFFYHANFVQQANFDFRGIFWSNFFRKGLLFFYILIFFWLNWKIELTNLVWVQIFTALVASGVSFVFGRPYLKFTKKVNWEWVKKLFHFGKFVFGTNLNAMLYKNIDKMMLGSMVSKPAVAMYELAIRITNLAEVPSFSIAAIVYPQSVKQGEAAGAKAIKSLYEQSVGAILAILLPFILIVLLIPEWIVRLVGEEQYLDAVPVLQLTVLYGLFIPFAIQFGTVLDSVGKPKLNFLFTLLGIVVNLVFNFIFISVYGLIGAAIGTLSAYLILFVCHQILLYRLFGIQAHHALSYIIPFYKKMIHQIFHLIKRKRS